jgi:hypothetical protein
VTAVTQDSASSGFDELQPGQRAGGSWSLSNLAGGATETLIIRVQRPFESGSVHQLGVGLFVRYDRDQQYLNNSDTAQYSITPRCRT